MLLQLCLLCSFRDRCFKFATEESLFRHVKIDDNHLKTIYQTLLINLNCPCTLPEFHLWSGEAAAFLFFSAVFRSPPFFCTGNWITEITIWHQPVLCNSYFFCSSSVPFCFHYFHVFNTDGFGRCVNIGSENYMHSHMKPWHTRFLSCCCKSPQQLITNKQPITRLWLASRLRH